MGRSTLEIVRDNMRQIGFRFRSGQHAAEDDWPVYCRRAEGVEGGAEGSYGGFTYIFGSSGGVWQSYDEGLPSTVRNDITYVLYPRDATPTFNREPRTMENLSLRTRDRWLSNVWMGPRQANMAGYPDGLRAMLVRWHDTAGEVETTFAVGEIVGLLTDQVQVEARRQRERDYMRLAETRRRLQAGEPIAFHERDLSRSPVPPTPLAPTKTREHVVWLPAQTNGFQHPDKAKTVYPGRIRRLALDHRPAVGSVLRGWGPDPMAKTINGVAVTWERRPKQGRWEARITTEDAEKIVV